MLKDLYVLMDLYVCNSLTACVDVKPTEVHLLQVMIRLCEFFIFGLLHVCGCVPRV